MPIINGISHFYCVFFLFAILALNKFWTNREMSKCRNKFTLEHVFIGIMWNLFYCVLVFSARLLYFLGYAINLKNCAMYTCDISLFITITNSSRFKFTKRFNMKWYTFVLQLWRWWCKWRMTQRLIIIYRITRMNNVYQGRNDSTVILHLVGSIRLQNVSIPDEESRYINLVFFPFI